MSVNSNSNNADEKVFKAVIEALQDLQFGSVTVTVHNSKVVQIDRVEKKRFDRETIDIGGGI